MPQNQNKKKKDPLAKSAAFFGERILMLLALCVMAWYYGGERAIRVILSGTGTAVLCDLAGGLMFYNRVTLRDLCAVFTGLAISLMMPAGVPYYVPAVASAFAIIAVKLPFGGALKYPAVPAAAGFAFATVCFPKLIFDYNPAFSSASGQLVSGNSLASMLQNSSSVHIDLISGFDILTGSVSGPMGTGCIIVLLGCCVFLLIRSPRAFVSTAGFLLACAVMALLFPRVNTGRAASLITELGAGSLLFAAVFFVNDPAVMPKTPLRRFAFGAFAGVICMAARYFGVYEESVCFAVVLADVSLPVFESAAKGIDSRLKRRKGAA